MKIRFVIILLLFSEILVAKTYWVAKSGNDKNSGASGSPFLTIQKGAEMAQPGDTVFVREGIYRERVSPSRGGSAGFPIVYKGEQNKNVIIKGSDVWAPVFQKHATSVYYAVPDESMFNDYGYVDNKNPFKVEVSSTPYGREGKQEYLRGFANSDPNLVFTLGQVFVDGFMYIQKPFLNEMLASTKTWFYDRNTGALYIHFEDDQPSGKLVEISTRRRIFAPHKRQLGYISVEGFIMEHCGNQYPTNFWESVHPEWQQAGAIGTRSGHHWIIKNNVIRFANGIGLDCGNEGLVTDDLETGSNGPASGSRYHVIDSNYILDNGGAGVAAYGPEYITFTNNVVERNNNLRFTGNKRWESAGVKMHGPNYSLLANNLIRNNYCSGIWLDGGAGKDTRIHGNLIIGNKTIGFDLEIGDAYPNKLIFDNNVLINHNEGISCRQSGGISAMNNLIMNASDYGIRNQITKDNGSHSDNHYYFNNVLFNCAVNMAIYPPDFYNSTDRRFDYNIYQAGTTQKKFRILYTLYTFSEWQSKWSNYNAWVNYDLNSRLTSQLSCSYDSATLSMQINPGAEYFLPKTMVYPNIDKDFLGLPIPTDGSALPGPFQNLKQENNQLKLWNGLRPLVEYEMPYSGIPTAINEPFAFQNQLKVYPNPTTGNFRIQIKSLYPIFDLRISIYDLSGKQIYFQKAENYGSNELNKLINFTGRRTGTYILHLSNDNINVKSKLVFLGN
jgi:hypothetical protein